MRSAMNLQLIADYLSAFEESSCRAVLPRQITALRLGRRALLKRTQDAPTSLHAKRCT